MKKTLTLIALLAVLPMAAVGQTMYKCPDPSGTVKFQQMPCSPTGGGEAVQVKPIPAGAGSGLSDSAKRSNGFANAPIRRYGRLLNSD